MIDSYEMTRAISAQRLTASRQQSAYHSIPPSSSNRTCSTPYGITATIRKTCCGIDSAEIIRCSTPYGITATIRQPRRDGHRAHQGCSTPYGITATISEQLHREGVFKCMVLRCSTPYGITATIRSVLAPFHAFLNSCAQRLTASRQQSDTM